MSDNAEKEDEIISDHMTPKQQEEFKEYLRVELKKLQDLGVSKYLKEVERCDRDT